MHVVINMPFVILHADRPQTLDMTRHHIWYTVANNIIEVRAYKEILHNARKKMYGSSVIMWC